MSQPRESGSALGESSGQTDPTQSHRTRLNGAPGKDIEWVIKKFGSFNSAELELVGTVVYVDREAASGKNKAKLEQIAKLVHEVKLISASTRS
jgi:hypothetical protein